jgi:hypothetical protein
MKPTNHHRHHHSNLFGKLVSNRILLCDFFKVKNPKNTKIKNQHGVLLRFNNQQLTKDWKTKRIVLLLVIGGCPFIQTQKKRNNHKRFR